jgi:hypothetical protein
LSSGCFGPGFRDLGVEEVRGLPGVSREYDDVLWSGLLPLAKVIEVGIGTSGADNVEIRGIGFIGALEHSLECGAEREATAGDQTRGMDMAVNVGVVGDAIVACKLFRAPPAEEVLLDLMAFGMAADPTLELVVGEIGR